MLHGPVNHVLSCFPIINSLWSPHTFQILLIGIFFLNIDNIGSPVHQVLRFQQHHGTVGIPTVSGHHVGDNHIECFTVLTTQDMRITYPTRRTNHTGIKYRLISIQGFIIISIEANSHPDGFFTHAIAGEVNKQVSRLLAIPSQHSHK